jgi:hypothetical protein
MAESTDTALLALQHALPEAVSRALAPVTSELTRGGETLQGIRVGPLQPAAEFLDLEGVRLRLTQEQGAKPLPGQTNLVERLRPLLPEQRLMYVILEAPTRQAKCYLDAEGQQLLGVLWLPANGHEEEP